MANSKANATLATTHIQYTINSIDRVILYLKNLTGHL